MSRKITYYNYSRVGILTPADIFGADLVEWWRPEELSGYSNGDNITSWVSQGTLASNLYPPFPGTEPTATTNFINNLTGANFNGITDLFYSDGNITDYRFLSVQGRECFVYFVYLQTTGAISVLACTMNTNSGERDGFLLGSRTNGQEFVTVRVGNDTGGSFCTSTTSPTPSVALNSVNMLMFQGDMPPNGGVASPNTGILGVNSGAENLPYTNTSTSAIGNEVNDINLIIGCRLDLVQHFDGTLLEIGMVNRLSTLLERQQVVSYLENKYGGTFPI